jgi:hypothetical protein
MTISHYKIAMMGVRFLGGGESLKEFDGCKPPAKEKKIIDSLWEKLLPPHELFQPIWCANMKSEISVGTRFKTAQNSLIFCLQAGVLERKEDARHYFLGMYSWGY